MGDAGHEAMSEALIDPQQDALCSHSHSSSSARVERRNRPSLAAPRHFPQTLDARDDPTPLLDSRQLTGVGTPDLPSPHSTPALVLPGCPGVHLGLTLEGGHQPKIFVVLNRPGVDMGRCLWMHQGSGGGERSAPVAGYRYGYLRSPRSAYRRSYV
jgi:hypothetical protein